MEMHLKKGPRFFSKLVEPRVCSGGRTYKASPMPGGILALADARLSQSGSTPPRSTSTDPIDHLCAEAREQEAAMFKAMNEEMKKIGGVYTPMEQSRGVLTGRFRITEVSYVVNQQVAALGLVQLCHDPYTGSQVPVLCPPREEMLDANFFARHKWSGWDKRAWHDCERAPHVLLSDDESMMRDEDGKAIETPQVPMPAFLQRPAHNFAPYTPPTLFYIHPYHQAITANNLHGKSGTCTAVGPQQPAEGDVSSVPGLRSTPSVPTPDSAAFEPSVATPIPESPVFGSAMPADSNGMPGGVATNSSSSIAAASRTRLRSRIRNVTKNGPARSAESLVATSTTAKAALAEPIRPPELVAALNGEQRAGQDGGSANGNSQNRQTNGKINRHIIDSNLNSSMRNGSDVNWMSAAGSPKPVVYGERTFDRSVGGSGATMGRFSNEGSGGNAYDSNARFVC
jgi:hypothetical protein